MSSPPPPAQRLRLRYAKTGDARWVGHLDEGRFWERVFRRLDLPLAYSHGFNPQPKIQFAAALPVGVAGTAELMDVWLREQVQPDVWLERIGQSLPSGWALHSIEEVGMDAPAMQSSLRMAVYEVQWEPALDHSRLEAQAAWIVAQSAILRPHHKEPGRTYDLRPLIESMDVVPGDVAVLRMTLLSGPERSGRAPEVVAAMALDGAPHTITRVRLILADPEAGAASGLGDRVDG